MKSLLTFSLFVAASQCVALGQLSSLETPLSGNCAVEKSERSDCGYIGVTKEQCEQKGCCWSPINQERVPWCFHQNVNSCQGYKLHDLQETASGLNAVLELKTDCKIYSPDVKLLKFELWYETDTRIHFKISDLAGTSYEIPEELFVRPKSSSGTSKETATYEFVLLEDPVAFKVIRKADGEVLFDSSQAGGGSFMSPLIFGRQYLEISTRVPVDANIYGLGEAVHAFRRDPFGTRQTMWSRDAPTPKDQNVYGVHSFYLEMRKGKAHGVFLLNSNGMDVLIRRGSVTWKVLGGALEFYVFVGPTPADVVHQYYEVIGHPHMISYWSLGFQHCRYGYNNVWEVKEVVRRYREANIPLETMWTDIDYMDNMKDFTLDPKNFPLNEMKSLVKDLQSRTQKYILILDPAIKVEQNYGPYEDGVKEGIFIKQANGNVFTGKVWPGVTAFPDFTNPKTQNYWTKWISIFMKDLPVDGWWIDMNEPASFCNGQCGNFDAETETDEGTQKKFTIDQSADNDEFNPNSPGYKINNAGWEAPLDTATVSADALHHNNTLHYNVHNLYGHSEAIMTRNSILKINPGKRPFVLSRSTFPSSGVYAGHWTGDNWSNWEHLYLSIPAILNFQLFGIPYVGADICGFVGDTTEELCGRWMQLGAFYPFSRNHNGKGHRSQEPYLWPRVAEASRNALKVRYEMLPYFYTLFYQSHNFGATVLRPLFFEFPDDTDTYMLDRQFLIGSSVLITPCLTQGAVSVNGYFPNGVWYDWYTHRALTENNRGSKGTWIDVYAPYDHIPVHIRGGSIIPTQEAKLTVTESRETPFKLLVALDNKKPGGSSPSTVASGDLFLDDGISWPMMKSSYIHFECNKASKSEMDTESKVYTLAASGFFGYKERKDILDDIVVLGLETKPSVLILNNAHVPASKWSYDGVIGELTIKQLGVDLSEEFELTWE